MHGIWVQLAEVALAHILAVASPGPDFAMVVRQSLAHGRRSALWTSVGIGSAILVHVCYALLGLGLLLRASPTLFSVLKFTGAGYLAWMGVKGLMARPNTSLAPVPKGAEGALAAPRAPSPAMAWVTGFLTNVFNPKATLFFVAVFASLLDPRTPKPIQAAFGLWMSLATMGWFCMVSLVLTREDVRGAFLCRVHWLDRVMGAVFIGLAAALALAHLG